LTIFTKVLILFPFINKFSKTMNLRITLLLLFAFISQIAVAQSGEDCVNAIPIPYSSQWCGTYNNVGATTDLTAVNFNPLGLSCNPNENEIWFSFVATPPLFDLIISVEGVQDGAIDPLNMPRITVVSGICDVILEANYCVEAPIGANSASLTIPANNFIPGFTYYILVSDWSETAASNEGAFDICMEELTEITVPPTGGGPYTGCSGIIHDTGGPTGNYSDNENYSFDICPSDGFTCLELNIDYDTEPENGDIINIYGSVPGVTGTVLMNTLEGVNQDLIVLSTGCVTVEFMSGGNINEAGYTIEWSCNQEECYSSESISSLEVNPTIIEDTVCLGQCVTLQVDPTDIIETTHYIVEDIPYTPFPFIGANQIYSNSGTQTFGDDSYSELIQLPFDFCFYGTFHDECVVGSNGVLSFNTQYAEQASGYTFNEDLPSDAIQGNNTNLTNAILFPWHDINPNDGANNGGAYWSIYGTAPFRVFVVSINNVTEFQCGITTTQQVALYESTNIVETYISNKPACTWNGGDGMHAIQNALGNQAVVVPGRNLSDSPWTTSNDGKRFSPAGTQVVPIEVLWVDGEDNVVGTGVSLPNVCPAETEIYHAQVTYNDVNGIICSNSALTIVDSAQVVVTTQGVFAYEISDDLIICTGESISIGGMATAGVTYTWDPVTDLDLTDPANPIASPSVTTTYNLLASNGGCEISDAVTVTVVSDPSPTVTGVFQICAGATTTVDAGAGYTQYEWSTTETTQTIDINTVGDYSVTVTLPTGCTGETTISVVNASDITIQLVSVTPNSCDNPNGAIDVNVPSGVAPFTYDWTGDAAGQGEDPVGLTADTYSVTVSDAAGCTATLEVVVPQQDGVTASVDNDTVCIGQLVQLNAVGGNGTYIWTSSNAPVSDSNIPNPTANPTSTTTYYVRSETNSGNLVANGDFESGDTGFTSNYVLGTGGAFGDLSNTATYGIYTSPDQGHINFDPCGDHTTGAGNMMVVNGADTPDQNVWCQTVAVEAGLDYNFSAWLTSAVAGSPAELQFEINGTTLGDVFTLANQTCSWQQYNGIWNSGSNTSATICILNQNTAGGGNDFALDDISFNQYCTQEDSVTVYVSQPNATIIDTNNDFCGSDLGSLTAEGSNGYGPYSYQWDTNANSQTTATATNLSGNDVYFVTVTDAYGCATQTSAFIQDLGSIPAEISGDLTICSGENTTLTAGPVAFDSYLWSDAAGTTTADISVDTPGDYTVSVTSGSCVGTATVTVVVAPNPTPTITGDTDLCQGVTSLLDAGAGYASYEWSNVTTNQMLNVGFPGTYSVTVTTADGCTGSDMVTVTVTSLPLSISGDNNLCLGESTTLSANTQGAVVWYDANGTVVANGPTLTITPTIIGAMDYTAEAFDNTCSTTETITVTVSETPTVIASGDQNICAGQTADISATTDIGTLMWNPANEFTTPSLANQTVSPSGTTTYFVTADNNGCEATDDVTITVSDAPIYGVLDDSSICAGESISIGVLNDGNTTYSWTANPADASLTQTGIGNPVVAPSQTTTYTLTATNGLCTETGMVTITVVNPSISFTPPATICPNETVTLTATEDPIGGTITWLGWEGDTVGVGNSIDVAPSATTSYTVNYEIDGCSASLIAEVNVVPLASTSLSATATELIVGESSTITVNGAPTGSTYIWTADNDINPSGDDIITVTPEESTTYLVTITTPEGCVSTVSILINVAFLEFEVPNIFTPNNDGTNDRFFPIHNDLSHEIIEFKVFDRWGELVHDNNSEGWDGTYNSKIAPSDIYVYFVRVRFNDGTEEFRKGDVALMR